MKTDETKRIAELEQLIRKYQASYYNGEGEIPDSEFDLLWDELKTQAPDSPVLAAIGADSVDGFPKAKHLIPMGSQDKAAGPEEFRAWVLKMRLSTLLVQYKLDGAGIELQYEKGALIRAVTRGDGITGDEITANARRMTSVPPALDIAFSGGVRGEVILTHDIWRNKYASKANCRNAANGIMRRKDGIGCEDLRVIVYDAAAIDDGADTSYFQDEARKIEWLTQRGFETTPCKIFNNTEDIVNAEDIIAYRAEVAALREQLPFDIDGLVVKDIVTDMADLRRPRPEKQIAFKFELETAFSILRAVEWSESGATYTPIGIIDPVRLAGTTVQRANLNNPAMIRSMGLKIGSVVSVVKRGEIIPKIEGLAPASEAKSAVEEAIEFPRRCAVCGTDLIDADTRLYCPNAACPKRLLHRLEKWVSVLDIRELGEKLLRRLFDTERVRRIHDLYTLTQAELADYERMGELSAAKVIRHIQTRRELSLAAFIAGFDLEGIAEITMEKVAAAGFNTLERLRAACTEDLAAIYGLGDITAAVIADGLKETAGEMDAVLAAGVISIAAPLDTALPLAGLSFCFTGELSSMKRNQAEERIKALGAGAKSSVVKGLSYLVTNDPESGSAKNKKARELSIPIIDEEAFLAMLSAVTKGTHPEGVVQAELF